MRDASRVRGIADRLDRSLLEDGAYSCCGGSGGHSPWCGRDYDLERVRGTVDRLLALAGVEHLPERWPTP